MTLKLTLSEVSEGLRFKKPYSFYIQEEDGFLLLEDPKLGLTIYAQDIENLEKDLIAELLSSWEYYALEEDENLTLGARKLKRILLDTLMPSKTK